MFKKMYIFKSLLELFIVPNTKVVNIKKSLGHLLFFVGFVHFFTSSILW